MIIPDANLLLYAFDGAAQHHSGSRAWLIDALSSCEPLGLASSTIVAFMRLSTHPRVFKAPLRTKQAIEVIDALAAYDQVCVLGPGPRHLDILRTLLLATQATGNLIADAYLAALAVENHGTVYTSDHDFDRFREVPVIYPLAEKQP